VISWGAAKVSFPRRPTHPPVSPVGTSGTSPEPLPWIVPAAARSAIDTERPGEPFTRTWLSTSSRSPRSASSSDAAASRSWSRTSAAAAKIARPELNVVCDPHEPASQFAAAVSWYSSVKFSGSMPSSSATNVGMAITAPLPFSCAPVTIVPLPSPFRWM
jgi:hypothetical protein